MRGPVALVAAAMACLAAMIIMMSVSALSLAALPGSGLTRPSATARRDIPDRMQALYQEAAQTCPGLPWNVLAAIGKVETDHGRAHDQVSSAGAVGPMQFLPSTFRAYAVPVPPGGKRPATPWDTTDAIYAAARLLCHNGAHSRGGAEQHAADRLKDTGIKQAIFAYNHATAYVAAVLRIARTYQSPAEPAIGPGSRAGRRAVAWALTQRGKPYRWGAEGPSSYDCSGLTMRAWQHTGVTIPRITYDQARTGTAVPRTALQPGDLLFFHPGPRGPEHVGLYLGNGRMVEAPHTGAVVRIASINRPDFAGARRPAA